MATPEGFVRLSVNVPKEEMEALAALAERQKRAKTELVREWLRTLPTYQPDKSQQR
jgi:predicted DNA-binding protein